jgi:hypothetical protein
VRSPSRDAGLEISANPALSFEGEPGAHLRSASLYGTVLLG